MKYAVEYALKAPMGGVKLTGGRLKKAFDNNVSFLKGFDVDRMLYWYRVHQGKPAPGVPYASDAGHFENNLKGQTAGEFMMGAGASLQNCRLYPMLSRNRAADMVSWLPSRS